MNSSLFVWSRSVAAPSSAPSTGEPPGRLGELAFLAGSTWVTRSGGEVSEESFVWGAGMQSLETIVVQRSEGVIVTTGNGRFVLNSTNGRILSASYIQGSYFASRELPPFRPGRWRFASETVGQGGGVESRVTMTQVDENTFTMSCKGKPPRVYHREPPR